MKPKEQDPLLPFKKEMDETLFENLHFDERLKNRVLNSISNEKPQQAGRQKLRSKKTALWSACAAAAAAVALAVLVITPPDSGQLVAEPPPIEMSPIENTPPGPLTLEGPPDTGEPVTNATPLLTPEPSPPNGPDRPGTLSTGTGGSGQNYYEDGYHWQPADVKEARSVYGDQLAVPSYIPESFSLDVIRASGNTRNEANQIVFSYVSEQRSYTVVQRKQAEAAPRTARPEIPGGEKATIHGAEAYITEEGTAGSGTAVKVQWFANGVQFEIDGTLSKEEALQVAGSMQ